VLVDPSPSRPSLAGSAAAPYRDRPTSVDIASDFADKNAGALPLAAVRTVGLGKRYGDFEALVDLDLTIPRVEVFGLLGPNGAGKTTLIRTLLGFIHRTSGYAEVMGIDPAIDSVAVRRQVSYLPGDARLPRHMRGHSVLKFFADIQPEGDLDNSLRIAERLELDLRRMVGFMSTGMRQKLAIAAVVGSRAPLLILDEPTANLDPTVRSRVLEMVMAAKNDRRTVIFSSHVLSEIEEVCDSVVLLRRGRLAHRQSLSDLKARHRIVARRNSAQATPATDSMIVPESIAAFVPSVQMDETTGRVTIETSGDLAPILPWLASLGLSEIRVEAFGLRAVYDAVHFDEVPAL
jgi:ABC-2 type transport system ATP-binding protein